VADPRRTPRMQGFVAARPVELQEPQTGTLATLPDLPTEIDADSTATYIRSVLAGTQPGAHADCAAGGAYFEFGGAAVTLVAVTGSDVLLSDGG
jgi:hypothetical protein